MSDPSSLYALVPVVSAIVGAGSGALGWMLGRGRALRQAERLAEEEATRTDAQTAAAELRLRELLLENARFRAISLAPREVGTRPLFHDRMAPAEHEAVVAALRGLAFVDDVVLADADGLARTRESDGRSSGLAALAASASTLAERIAKTGVGVDEVRIETGDARHLTVRMLAGRARGTLLVAESTSRPVNALGMDAAARLAAGESWEPRSDVGRPSSWRGSNERERAPEALAHEVEVELDREIARAQLRAIVCGKEGRASYSSASDGPAAPIRATLFDQLDLFRRDAARSLRSASIVRVDVVLTGAGALRFMALGDPEAHHVLLLGEDGPSSTTLAERLRGRLLRGRGAPRGAGGVGVASFAPSVSSAAPFSSSFRTGGH